MTRATTPRTRRFAQLDVFSAVPYRGNPLAVVLDGDGLDDATMQQFAAWTNLSETTFLLPPTDPAADYRVRIFTPGGELAFAGHPTLGSCHAWLGTGGVPRTPGRVVQQCAKGLVPIRVGGGTGAALAFAAPSLVRSAVAGDLLLQVAAALGLATDDIVAAQLLDNGTVWLGVLVADDAALHAVAPDHAALKKIGVKVGLAHIPYAKLAINNIANALPTTELQVRAFAAATGIDEDPVTGSLNASLAQWLMDDGYAPERYVARQGQALGRDGRVAVARDADGQVWVGGDTVACIGGTVLL